MGLLLLNAIFVFVRLIVACKYHPTPIVLNLIDLVAPSRPVVIFSQHKEVAQIEYNTLIIIGHIFVEVTKFLFCSGQYLNKEAVSTYILFSLVCMVAYAKS